MSRIATRVLGAAALVVALVGCAATPPPAANQDYKSQAVTRTEGGVRVSTAVLSADESATVYGVPLAKQSIQPVWIEVENREDRAYYLLSPRASRPHPTRIADESSSYALGCHRGGSRPGGGLRPDPEAPRNYAGNAADDRDRAVRRSGDPARDPARRRGQDTRRPGRFRRPQPSSSQSRRSGRGEVSGGTARRGQKKWAPGRPA